MRSYVVSWREQARDDFGVPTGKTIQRTETFASEKQAKARLRAIETHLAGVVGTDPSSAKAKADTPLGTYARQYLDSLVGSIDPNTIEDYEKIYRAHIAPVFGSRAVASITTAEVTAFRAQLLAPHVRQHNRAKTTSTPDKGAKTVVRSPKTVKHIVGTLKRILDTSQDDQAIPANPVIANRRRTTKRATADGKAPFKHRPLTANQVASVVDWITHTREITVTEKDADGAKRSRTYTRQENPIYALAVLFAAHPGVRASELQGLQVADVTLSDIPGTVGSVRIVRTAMRKDRTWHTGTPKSDASSDRVIPLAPWLADELRDYLVNTHPFGSQAGKRPTPTSYRYVAHAPLFPGRRNRHEFGWGQPVHAANLYEHYLQPACKALALGPVRFHDLRHTFATMNLSAGEHYMQVSKWLGHSTFVLTLTTYADYINEDEQAAPKVGRGTADTGNIVPLERKAL